MNTRTTRSIVKLASLAVVALLVAAPRAGAQSLQTERIMRQKLAQTQQLLAALVTSNWMQLDSHTRALQALTNQPGWDVMRLPEFRNYTTAFQRATQALVDASAMRDQRNALTAYTGLVSSCVECHTYVARARTASVK